MAAGVAEPTRNWKKRVSARSSNNSTGGTLASSWQLRHEYSIGQNIYKDDWDLLIILDACRVDALREVAPEYDFITDVQHRWSVGSTSNEWLSKTFTESYQDQIGETTYVTSNLFARKVLEEHEYPPTQHQERIPFSAHSWDTIDVSAFEYVDRVWQYADQEPDGSFPPRRVTDRAIHLARNQDPSRLVVHYMQPHSPYTPVNEPRKEQWLAGDIDKETIWEAYLETLRYVVDNVELLLKNVDSEQVVITADHGEAFREYGIPGHLLAFPQPDVKRVSWVETTATDTGSYDPAQYSRERITDDKVEQQLADLGYT